MWLSTVVDGRVIEVIRVHGGVKFYTGAANAARAYVERDRSHADDYYLAEGTGVAERVVATPDGVEKGGSMNGDTYEQWVAGIDVDTGAKKGRLLQDEHALRFVEVTVNGPKTWSLATALHPEISVALDAAQDQAAQEIVGWVAAHATTRIGPRGRQVQVPVEKIEAAVIRTTRRGPVTRTATFTSRSTHGCTPPTAGAVSTRWDSATRSKRSTVLGTRQSSPTEASVRRWPNTA